MWIARNKDRSLYLSMTKPVRGYINGNSPANIIDYWVYPDGIMPSYITEDIPIELEWEDAPMEIRFTTDKSLQETYDIGYDNGYMSGVNAYSDSFNNG